MAPLETQFYDAGNHRGATTLRKYLEKQEVETIPLSTNSWKCKYKDCDVSFEEAYDIDEGEDVLYLNVEKKDNSKLVKSVFEELKGVVGL